MTLKWFSPPMFYLTEKPRTLIPREKNIGRAKRGFDLTLVIKCYGQFWLGIAMNLENKLETCQK